MKDKLLKPTAPRCFLEYLSNFPARSLLHLGWLLRPIFEVPFSNRAQQESCSRDRFRFHASRCQPIPNR